MTYEEGAPNDVKGKILRDKVETILSNFEPYDGSNDIERREEWLRFADTVDFLRVPDDGTKKLIALKTSAKEARRWVGERTGKAKTANESWESFVDAACDYFSTENEVQNAAITLLHIKQETNLFLYNNQFSRLVKVLRGNVFYPKYLTKLYINGLDQQIRQRVVGQSCADDTLEQIMKLAIVVERRL